MIPFRTGHRVAFEKELASRARQHDTDIDRLWRLQQQLSTGEPIGGENLPPVAVPIRGQGDWLWAKTTSAVTAGTYSAPTSATVDVWIPDPTSVVWPTPMIVTTDPDYLGLAITNPTKAVLPVGEQCKIEWGPGGWSLKWIDC